MYVLILYIQKTRKNGCVMNQEKRPTHYKENQRMSANNDWSCRDKKVWQNHLPNIANASSFACRYSHVLQSVPPTHSGCSGK